ncbi:MAG: membrane protein insertion efficiency factor YidD [Vicinamibacterales bacterium]
MSTRMSASVAVATVMIAIALDLRRPPSDQLATRAAVGAIHIYQATLSPWYERLGVRCRFTPTCSHYGEAVITRFGIGRGGAMAIKRIFRCGPWTPAGTVDLPPL